MSKLKKNTVTNLKALAGFTATFDGSTAIITGRNNSGKSSFLRSLPDRFRGIKPPIILKEGESEGMQEWELTTGEKLIWNFNNKTAKGESLVYTYPSVDDEGKPKEIRVSVTKEIMNKFFPGSFDIDIFLNSTPQKQGKMMQEIVGLDFTVIDNRHKLAYDERTLANNKLKEAKLLLQPINEKLATVETDVEPIQQKLWAIDSHNRAYDKAYEAVHDPKSGLKKQRTDNDALIKNLEAQIKKLQQDNKTIDTRIVDGEKWLYEPDNQKKGDDYHFQVSTELQDAKDQNEKIKKNNEAIKKQEDLLQLDLDAKAKDRAVKDIEEEKTKMIQGAKMPEGFDFSDDGLLYNGLPLDRAQLSSSGIYIAALKLASMTIGEVRTLHFDASFLDKVSLAEIEKWASEQDLQLLIEMPDRDAGEIRFELIENIVE